MHGGQRNTMEQTSTLFSYCLSLLCLECNLTEKEHPWEHIMQTNARIQTRVPLAVM